MRDFHLYLPENTGLTKLAIVPKFDDIHPLIQRAVCLLVFHQDRGLLINGMSLADLTQQAVTQNSAILAQMLTSPADRLTQLLNREIPSVKSVEFLVDTADGKLAIDINIIPVDSDTPVSATIY